MSSMLEYIGYHAKIEFDAEDKIFVGEVFGINDSLNFHGITVTEIEDMFHQSIDNYLTLCKKIGKEPDREFKGTFNVRISPETHRKAALEASKQNITLNQFVAAAIEQSLNVKPATENTIYIISEITKQVPWKINTKSFFDPDEYLTIPQMPIILESGVTIFDRLHS